MIINNAIAIGLVFFIKIILINDTFTSSITLLYAVTAGGVPRGPNLHTPSPE